MSLRVFGLSGLLGLIILAYLLSGCSPAPLVPSPTPSPPTPETTRPNLGGCPVSFQTVVSAVYSGYGEAGGDYDPATLDGTPLPTFDVVITFDQPVTVMDSNPQSWQVEVERLVHYRRYGVPGTPHERSFATQTGPLLSQNQEVRVVWVSQFGTNSVRLRVQVRERPLGIPGDDYFYGLICDEWSYESYLTAANRNAGYDTPGQNDPYWTDRYLMQTPIFADRITWRYTGGAIPVADETGVPCLELCDIEGISCCEACPSVPPPVEWCLVVDGQLICP